MGALERPKFASPQPFRRALKERVDAYFEESGQARSGGWPMIAKSLLMIAWLLGSYAALLWLSLPVYGVVLLALSLALAIAGMGMNIHHDANHGAYSSRPWLNALGKRSLDFLGVSSYLWGFTHNVFHHTYTNIDGIDQDLDLAPVARLAPTQKRHVLHRFQRGYMWIVYSFTLFYFVLAEDLIQINRAYHGPHAFPPPKRTELLAIIAAKLWLCSWALLLPLYYHPWWKLLLVLVGVGMIAGFVLGLTFQVAHLIPEASFPDATASEPLPEWAIHQAQNTAGFAHQSALITWYVGGLNYQLEHHLFPKVCHIHYPKIAPIVKQTCQDFDVPYLEYSSTRAALRAHGRWLGQMAQPSDSSRLPAP